MRMRILLSIYFFALSSVLIIAQEDIQIGSTNDTKPTASGALFDYSDANTVNIKVQLWGSVRFPGYYIVPAGTSIIELISLAGGPTEDALLDDVRLIKIKEGAETVMLKYNYNDFLWEDKINSNIKYRKLDAGDIVSIPGEPRYFAREDVVFYLSVVTTLATLALLIITIINTNF